MDEGSRPYICGHATPRTLRFVPPSSPSWNEPHKIILVLGLEYSVIIQARPQMSVMTADVSHHHHNVSQMFEKM